MIQFTVVTRKPYDFVSNPMKKRHIWIPSQKIPIESIFSIWSSSQWWPGKPMDLLHIHWINEDRRTLLTHPPSDFRQNACNQTGFALDIILSFKRFERKSTVLKCDHRLCESPATPKNSRWLPNFAKIPLWLPQLVEIDQIPSQKISIESIFSICPPKNNCVFMISRRYAAPS